MMRGNNRESIFSKDEQKRFFLDILKKQDEEQLIDIAAYCLMDNYEGNNKEFVEELRVCHTNIRKFLNNI